MSHSCDYIANKVHFLKSLAELFSINLHILIKAYKRSNVNGIRMDEYESDS